MSDRDNLLKIMRGFQTAMLVSHGVDGSLRGRPMAVAEVKEDGDIIFATNLKSLKVSEIENVSNVAVTFQQGSQYAAISGMARVTQDQTLIDRLWSETWRVWFPEGKDDPNLCLLTIDAHTGEFWDNAGLQGLEFVFESLKAVIQGTTPSNDSDQHAKTTL